MQDLTYNDQVLIIQALHAVAPMGGGSPQFHLACRLQVEWAIATEDWPTISHDQFWRGVGELQKRAWQEVCDVAAEMEITPKEL